MGCFAHSAESFQAGNGLSRKIRACWVKHFNEAARRDQHEGGLWTIERDNTSEAQSGIDQCFQFILLAAGEPHRNRFIRPFEQQGSVRSDSSDDAFNFCPLAVAITCSP